MRAAARQIIGTGIGVLIGALLTVGAACTGDADEEACKIDTDCPQGNICREQRCGPVSPDGSTSTNDVTAPPACAVENAACAVPDDCCTKNCNLGRCQSSITPPPTCKGSLELCQNDCCAGFTCTSGVCR